VELTARKSLPSGLLAQIPADIERRLDYTGPTTVKRVWMKRHPYSCIFRVDCDTSDGELSIFLKCNDSSEPPLKQLRWAERFEAEFRILEALWSEFGDGNDIGVVRPLKFYSEYSTLATVGAAGERLRKYLREQIPALRSLASTPDDALQYMRRCGRWLRRFHKVTAVEPRPFDADELLEYCEDRLVMLQQNPRINLDARLASQVIDRLAATAGGATGLIAPMAGCHGDFMSHNIMVQPRRMRVLDFTMYEINSTYYDACGFWSELELMKQRPRAPTQHLSRLQAAFLESYGEANPEDPLFMAIHIRYLLVAFCRVAEPGHSGILPRLSDWHAARKFHDRIRHYAVSGH
jgi:hypothetical protein